MKIKKSTIVRTIVLIVAIVNKFLTTKGMGFNLFMSEELAGLLADLFLSVISIITFWYNNSFTKNAIAADNYLEDLNGLADAFDNDIPLEENEDDNTL